MSCRVRPSEKSQSEQRRAFQQVNRALKALCRDVGDGAGASVGGTGTGRWTPFDRNAYDSEPASSSTITMREDLTDFVQPGMPLRYQWLGTHYYGIVQAITAFLLTVSGAPLDTEYRLDGLWLGAPEMLTQVHLRIGGAYGADEETDALTVIGLNSFRWLGPPAAIVGFQAIHVTDDSSGQPYVNVKVTRA